MKKTVLIECEQQVSAMMYGEMLQWVANKIPKSQDALMVFHKSVAEFNTKMMDERNSNKGVDPHNRLLSVFNKTIVALVEHPDVDLDAGWTSLRWYIAATEYKVCVYQVQHGLVIHLDTGIVELRDAIRGLPEFFQREMDLFSAVL